MTAKYILAILGVVFLLAAGVRLAKDPPLPANERAIRDSFGSQCRYDKWVKGEPPPKRNPAPPRSSPTGMHLDHSHDVGLGGLYKDVEALKWVNSRVNTTHGAAMQNYDAEKKLTVTSSCCD